MSLRPIDLTVAVQRSADTAKTGVDPQHRPEVLHQQYTEQLQKQFQRHERQVQQSDKTLSANIKRDGKGQKREAGRDAKKNQKNGQKNSSTEKQNIGGSLLDILV